jgi:hypothetical protein
MLLAAAALLSMPAETKGKLAPPLPAAAAANEPSMVPTALLLLVLLPAAAACAQSSGMGLLLLLRSAGLDAVLGLVGSLEPSLAALIAA